MTFVADIVTATEIQYVVIETLRFEQSASRPDEIEYLIALRESPPPPPPPAPSLDDGLLDEAGGFLDSVTGALNAIDAVSVPDFGDPTPPLSGTLDGTKAALEGLSEVPGKLTDLFGSGVLTVATIFEQLEQGLQSSDLTSALGTPGREPDRDRQCGQRPGLAPAELDRRLRQRTLGASDARSSRAATTCSGASPRSRARCRPTSRRSPAT